MRINVKELSLFPAVMCFMLVMQTALTFHVYAFTLPLSYLCLATCILNCGIMFCFYLIKPKMSYFGLSVVIFYWLILIFTLIHGHDFKNAVFKSIEGFLLLLIFNIYQGKFPLLLKTIAASFSFCIYINLLFMLLFPDWAFQAEESLNSFFLGGNYNQMGPRMLLGILLNILCCNYNKKWRINTFITIFVSITTLLIVGSMTSLSTLTLFCLCAMVPSVRLLKNIAASYFLFYIFFTLFVVLSGESLHNNEIAVYIVEDVLGKDITFTNRTSMWDAALRVIEQSPIIGYGWVTKEWYLSHLSPFAIGAHNFLLSIFIYGGIVLFIDFCWMVFSAATRLLGHLDKPGVTLLLAIVTILFMMCFEVYDPFFIILLLTLAYYYPQIQESFRDNHPETLTIEES